MNDLKQWLMYDQVVLLRATVFAELNAMAELCCAVAASAYDWINDLLVCMELCQDIRLLCCFVNAYVVLTLGCTLCTTMLG